ncbi:ketopantoate reductase family protein [Nevskia soli]|uniref:ketopantoate reductase family protein n=1 Tax=Nevskia soli TaxID=418856 RepID=UPI0004A6B7E1|nr:ketopantoate reductase family protein [Nevskia soli]
MRLLVVGAGSTGGYLGARLSKAGRDVTFLVRPERASLLRRDGLHVESPLGNVVLAPKVVTSGALDANYDAILLAVKAFQLDAALADLAPAVGSDTMILPVLNGMRHMDLLAKRFSSRNLVGCALKVATELQNDGRIVQLNPNQDFAYGELDGILSPRIGALDQFMQGAEIGARLSQDISRELWEKWILLASVGAITCLMRGTIGEIEASPGGAELALNLFDEVIGIVSACGEPPSDGFVGATRSLLTAKGSGFASSMFRDLKRGRAVESESIVGDLVRHGQAAGISAPLLATAYAHLSVYQRQIVAR